MVLLRAAKLVPQLHVTNKDGEINPKHSAGIESDEWASATKRYWPFRLTANSRATERSLSRKPDFTLYQFTPKRPHVTKCTSVDAEFCCCVTNSIAG
jgi:hypothetical protein